MTRLFKFNGLTWDWSEILNCWTAPCILGKYKVMRVSDTQEWFWAVTSGPMHACTGPDEGKQCAEDDFLKSLGPGFEPTEAPKESGTVEYVAQTAVLEYDWQTKTHEETPTWVDYCCPQDSASSASSASSATSVWAEWGREKEHYAARFRDRFLGRNQPLHRFRTLRRETIIRDTVMFSQEVPHS